MYIQDLKTSNIFFANIKKTDFSLPTHCGKREGMNKEKKWKGMEGYGWEWNGIDGNGMECKEVQGNVRECTGP